MEAAWELKPKIEALLIAAGCAVTLEALARCLEVSVDEAEEAVREFALDLLGADRGIQLRRRPTACASRPSRSTRICSGVCCPGGRPSP
jgi:chromosome segregation and condensation protein ScpB